MRKICNVCKVTRPVEEFNRKGEGYQAKCRQCQKEWYQGYYKRNPSEKERVRNRTKRLRVEARALILLAKEKPCMDCGVKYPYYVMDFDHRVPSLKNFNIAHNAYHTNLDELKIEIAKCDVVCSNCHRERTHKQRLDKDEEVL